MAGSLKTAFYNLVKYAANDITSWLTDFNGNMDKIDTALNNNKTAVDTAQTGVDNLENEYGTIVQTLSQHTITIDANEKAIAENSASIEELGNEVNKIIIGDYSFKTSSDSDVTKIEPLANNINIAARRVGNGVQVSGNMEMTPGSMHRYDRQIPNGIYANRYVTDIYRFSGNPFNLPSNVYCPFTASGPNITKNITIEEVPYEIATAFRSIPLVIAYLAESGYTIVGLASIDNEQYGMNGGDILILNLS